MNFKGIATVVGEASAIDLRIEAATATAEAEATLDIAVADAMLNLAEDDEKLQGIAQARAMFSTIRSLDIGSLLNP